MKRTFIIFLFALLCICTFAKRRVCRRLTPSQKACYVGGCSGQLCTEDPGIMTTCEWKDEYACYRDATCERQSTGQCGWTSTPELAQCLANPTSDPGLCYIGGCSSELCTDQPDATSDCVWMDAYACYGSATCERQTNGQCGWTSTPELQECLANPPGQVGQCYVGGCSSQLCTEDPNIVSTCEWKDEYACYQDATCERQSTGQCGWTSTPELEQCLANPLGEPTIPIPPVTGKCFVGGCSGQLCSSEPGAMSTCEWREEYACYRDARCEIQGDGQCGWTSTPEYEQCLATTSSAVQDIAVDSGNV